MNSVCDNGIKMKKKSGRVDTDVSGYKLLYLFSYKALHFLKENMLVRSKSAQNSGFVLLPSVFVQQT